MTQHDVASHGAPSLLQREAQDRIDRQKDLLAALRPGTDDYRLASKVLTLLQDSADLIAESRVMIVIARMSFAGGR